METILIIIVVAVAVALLLGGSEAPRPQVIYVPLTIEEPQGGNLGCLPLLVVAVLALVLLGGGLG
jgi:hypothetical protein